MKKEFSYFETIKMINETKKYFEEQLESKLSLIKVQSPLFVRGDSGLQDGLTGIEKSICFGKKGEEFEIVHSLAKWKRDALGRYNFSMHTGLYTDMKAIRKDEEVDEIHSMYVEQWDWEKIIDKKDRNIEYLIKTANSVYECIKNTSKYLENNYLDIYNDLAKDLFFITSQELENMYPEIVPREREELITKEKGSVFIIGIGDKLYSGIQHDLRSPDYDDWSLNGDLLIYSHILGKAIEITSMGIRVDEYSIISQLEKANCLERINLPYHQKIINRELPYTIGGGIGQSRIFMLLLNKSHIAEVQASSWQKETLNKIKTRKIL